MARLGNIVQQTKDRKNRNKFSTITTRCNDQTRLNRIGKSKRCGLGCLLTGVFNWHLDDWVKLATIGAMLVSIAYTLAKFYYLIKRGKALDTVRGDE